MDPSIILGTIILVPVLLLTLLRVNAVLVFLSLCLGSVLVQLVSPDAAGLLDLFNSSAGQSVSASNSTLNLALFLFPAVATALFMIRTVHGGLAIFVNLIPALGVGLLLALLGVPLLSKGLSHEIMSSPLWQEGQRARTLIVGASTLAALFVLWLQRPKHPKKHKH